ncbi:MAG: MotA/TolQ/ExbB proton channel family protein [Spirochaetota bacterium]|nr:MotA/TolQ/ExbB proton channel family protein [Spirochaetota bacterium]
MRIRITKLIIINILIFFISFFFICMLPVYSQTKKIAPSQEIREIKGESQILDEESLQEDFQSTQKAEEDLMTEDKGENLFSTVTQGGPLMIFVVLLGIISITLIIERIIFFTRNKMWNPRQMEAYLTEMAEKSETLYHEDMEDELRSTFQIYANSMERGMALLSGIGNLSPIVGFLGTVIGMISAFAAIAAATSVNAKVVAVGIQIALVTTAGGLMIAAPALTFYYLFTHIIQNRYTRAEEIINRFCEKLPRLSEKLTKEEVADG